MKYINLPINSTCPVCKKQNGLKLWEANNRDSAQHFILKEKDEKAFNNLAVHIERLWGQGTNSVVKCLNCGLCYSFPFVAGDEKFYTLAYERSDYPKWKWEYQETLDQLIRKQDQFSYLEIGAGNGAFIKSFINIQTSKENIYCTEYSDYGLKELKKIKVNVYNSDVRNLNINKEFDVICMFQVLEHLDDIDSLFNKINKLLLKEGDFFVAVPSYEFIEFIELNNALLDMPPNHVTRWTLEAFETIALKYNWKIKNYSVEPPKWIKNVNLFANYYFLRKSQKKGTIANFISSLNISLNILRFLKLIGILVYSFSLIHFFYKLKTYRIGNSQWVHFRKQ